MDSTALAKAQSFVQQHHARFIDLKAVDLGGSLRHVTLPAGSLNEDLMRTGVGFDGSSYGFKKVHASDMILIPDLDTMHLDPYRGSPTVSFLASVHVTEEGLPLSDQDSRAILKRAMETLRSTGIGDDILMAPEYEFYIFENIEHSVTTAESRFQILGGEDDEANCYHLINPDDLYAGFRDDAVLALQELGMPIRYHHHETGGHGQQEIEFDLAPAHLAADHAILVRYVLLNLAQKQGIKVTFMPKPLFEQPGSGWHVHQMLVAHGTDGKTHNLFHDPSDSLGLSRKAMQWIGGQLRHGCAMAAFTNASTNSYKRLISGFEAPNSLTFGPADRTAAIRIPRWAQGEATRLEYRPGDFTGNPYLTLAALIMAGIDGVLNEVDPVAEGYGPAEHLDKERISKLPANLEGALESLKNDNAFLKRDGVFPSSVLERWTERKAHEAREVALRPHPVEFKLYFNR